jgi:hypothetical protein
MNRTLVLFHFDDIRFGLTPDKKVTTRVSSVDDLMNTIKDCYVRPYADEYYEDDDYEEPTLTEDDIEGRFDSDMFIVWTDPDNQIVCMTQERYDTVKHLNGHELEDYVVEWITLVH